jgi:hypothetical protein
LELLRDGVGSAAADSLPDVVLVTATVFVFFAGEALELGGGGGGFPAPGRQSVVPGPTCIRLADDSL